MSAEGTLIDLGAQRDLGQILGVTFRLYRAYFSLFAAIAFAVVIPVDVLIYGVAGERLWTNPDWGDSLPLGAEVAAVLAPWLVTTPLITAGHVHAVMDIGAGREPSAGRALKAAAARLTPVAGAVTLAAIGSALGLILLIVPGVYLWRAGTCRPRPWSPRTSAPSRAYGAAPSWSAGGGGSSSAPRS